MEVSMKFFLSLCIAIIFAINKSHATLNDDMQALENDLKFEDMKILQKKSVKDMSTEELIEELKKDLGNNKQDMSTEELIEELKKDLGNNKQEKKSHKSRFDNIIEKSSSSDFDKLWLESDATNIQLKKKSAIKVPEDADVGLLKDAIAKLEELKHADVNDPLAQKKSLDLLQKLMKSDKESSRKVMEDTAKRAIDLTQRKETARFAAALEADRANMKQIDKEGRTKRKDEDEGLKISKKRNKTLQETLNDIEKNEVEVKQSKGKMMEKALKLMADDLVKEISDEVSSKRSNEIKHLDANLKCADKRTDCRRLLEFCDDYKDKLQNICAKSCKFCEPCQDNWIGKLAHRCQIIVTQGMCPRKGVEKYCRRSCGYCKIPAPPKCSQTKYGCCWDKTTTRTDKRGGNCPGCKDQYKYVCDRFRMECNNTNKAGTFMRQHCPEKCGLCSYTCRDDPKKAFYCPFWKKDLKWCSTRKEVMKHFCPVTCGLC